MSNEDTSDIHQNMEKLIRDRLNQLEKDKIVEDEWACTTLSKVSDSLQDLFENRKSNEACKQFSTNLAANREERKMLEEIFGFTLNFLPVSPNILDIEIKFSDTQKVLISYERHEQLFALSDMTPKHPNFKEIQKYLFETQDTAGFMAQLNLYFSTKNI